MTKLTEIEFNWLKDNYPHKLNIDLAEFLEVKTTLIVYYAKKSKWKKEPNYIRNSHLKNIENAEKKKYNQMLKFANSLDHNKYKRLAPAFNKYGFYKFLKMFEKNKE